MLFNIAVNTTVLFIETFVIIQLNMSFIPKPNSFKIHSGQPDFGPILRVCALLNETVLLAVYKTLLLDSSPACSYFTMF